MWRRIVFLAVGVVGCLAFLFVGGAVALHLYVREPEPLTLEGFSAESLAPWPDGILVVDSWSGTEGPGGGNAEPEAESLYLLLSGEGADGREEPLVATVTQHLRSLGWDLKPSNSRCDSMWGYNDRPRTNLHVGRFEDYLDCGPGRGVPRSTADLIAAHGSGLVVVMVSARDSAADG